MRQPVVGVLVFSFFFVSMIVLPRRAFAQQSPSPLSLVAPIVVQQPSELTTQLATLREQYRTQLDIYRNDERNFGISRDQYYQLQTLTSLEEAVKSTQKVLLSRDDVLITYLKMLRVVLSQTTGIQLQLKNDQLKLIDDLISELNKNQELAAHAVSRDQIRQTVADFSLIGPTLQYTSSQVLLIVSYGKVQALFDKTLAIHDEIKTHVLQRETDALKLSEKQRAFEQMGSTVQDVDRELKGVLSSLNGTQDRYSSSAAEQLNQAYAGISRTLSYLREVLAS